MSAGSVVYSKSIRCPECGLLASGYMHVTDTGTLTSSCPRCGAKIQQQPAPGTVAQLPPQPYHAHTRHDHRQSKHPGLYSQPKSSPKLDLGNLLMIPFRPTAALRALFLSTDMKSAVMLVLLIAIIYSVFAAFVTAEMSDVLGMEQANAVETMALAVLEIVIALVSFLIFSLVSAMIASSLFGGRGDMGATTSLLGYCYPWFVVVSAILMLIFVGGFSGLEFSQVEHWTNRELEDAIVWGIALLAAAVAGLIWLLILAGKAIGVANNVSTGEGAMSALIGAIVAGLVSLATGVVIRLPVGLSF